MRMTGYVWERERVKGDVFNVFCIANHNATEKGENEKKERKRKVIWNKNEWKLLLNMKKSESMQDRSVAIESLCYVKRREKVRGA